jgi:prephenate dehydrogenase
VIALDLKEGAVILDTSAVKNGVLAWASEVLLPGRHLVSWTPAMNPSYIQETAVGIEAAHADLFQNSLIFITHAQGIDAEVVKLAADVATLVGGKPFFADPFEVDGLMAASHILPQLVAAALLGSLLAQPGWDENRKLSGRNLIEATAPLTHLDESTHLGQSALLNGDNVVRVLDDLINSLYELREAIAHKDGNKVQSALEKAVSGRAEWLLQRQAGNWTAEKQIQPELPSSGQKLGQLIGFGRRKSPKTDK